MKHDKLKPEVKVKLEIRYSDGVEFATTTMPLQEWKQHCANERMAELEKAFQEARAKRIAFEEKRKQVRQLMNEIEAYDNGAK